MIVETFIVFAVLIGGCCTVRLLGVRGWPVAPLGLLVGLAMQVLLVTLQLSLRMTTSPWLTLVLVSVPPLALWCYFLYRRRDVGVRWTAVLLVAGAVALATMVLRSLWLVKYHVDSLVYLKVGVLFWADKWDEAQSGYLLEKRLVGVPAIHAAANLHAEDYIQSLTPLIALAALGVMYWILSTGLRGIASPRAIPVFGGLAVLLMVATNRFVFHAFYLNGHLITGAWVALVAGAAWLAARKQGPSTGALAVMGGVGIAAVILTRAEGTVMAATLIAPVLLLSAVPRSFKFAVGFSAAAAALVWYGWIPLLYGFHYSTSILSQCVSGGLFLLATLAVAIVPRWFARERLLLNLLEVGVWLALCIYALRDFDVLQRSFLATAANTVEGRWGVSLVLVILLVAAAALSTRLQHGVLLRFPVTVFLPAAFLLSYLREGAYRVGHFDSLNRMWMQILVLAVVYVAAAAAAGELRFKALLRVREDSGPQASPAGDTRTRT